MANLQQRLDAIGDDPVDWWNSRVAAQQEFAEQSFLIAQQHRNTVARSGIPVDGSRIEKLNFVVSEASKRHVAEQSYYPHAKTPSRSARSRHHLYWLTAIGLLTITIAVFSFISLALWFAPFATPVVHFVIRMIMPFVIGSLLLAIGVTAITHYAKRLG